MGLGGLLFGVGAALGTPGRPAAGGTGTKWPSPLGRVSGPEPRALRFRPGSSPSPQTRVGQSGQRAGARVHQAPGTGAPAPAGASGGCPVAPSPEGWLEGTRLPGILIGLRVAQHRLVARGEKPGGFEGQGEGRGALALGTEWDQKSCRLGMGGTAAAHRRQGVLRLVEVRLRSWACARQVPRLLAGVCPTRWRWEEGAGVERVRGRGTSPKRKRTGGHRPGWAAGAQGHGQEEGDATEQGWMRQEAGMLEGPQDPPAAREGRAPRARWGGH